MKKILFITHDVSRSGAPMVLLNFMKWLKVQHPHLKLEVMALRNGELREDFQKIADGFYNLPKKSIFTRLRTRFSSEDGGLPDDFIRGILKKDYDLVYANTVSALPLGIALKSRKKDLKLIGHIHELTTTIQMLQPKFAEYAVHADLFIAASQMVSEALKEDFSVPENKIKVVYEFTEKLEPNSEEQKDEVFRVGAAGTFHWRKGGDVFLQVARRIKDYYPEYPIQFNWIGKVPESEKLIAEADILKMGLQDTVKFTGLVKNPVKHFRDLDVFLLPSREDPFPLVCIEVGKLGIPIICFEKATGIAEVLENGGGFIVPYLNSEAMTEKVIYYYKNLKKLTSDGRENILRFSGFTLENKCSEIYSHLENM